MSHYWLFISNICIITCQDVAWKNIISNHSAKFYLSELWEHRFQKGNHRINADRVRPCENSIYCWVQLQNLVSLECLISEQEQGENTDQLSDLSHGTSKAVTGLKLQSVIVYQWHLRPVAPHSRIEHRPDAPARAKQIEGLRETVVVNDARVNREDSHKQDDVAPCKHHAEHLRYNIRNYIKISGEKKCRTRQMRDKSKLFFLKHEMLHFCKYQLKPHSSESCTVQGLVCVTYKKCVGLVRWPWWDPYLIIVLLGHQPALS